MKYPRKDDASSTGRQTLSIDPIKAIPLDWPGMNLRWRYLAASLLAFAKPFLAGTVAFRLGFAEKGPFPEAFLRVLLFPQAAAAACFVLLFFDSLAYRTYKPLAALTHAGSLAALALGALPALKDTQALVLLAGDAQGAAETVVLYLGLALIDLSCLAILATGREKPRT